MSDAKIYRVGEYKVSVKEEKDFALVSNYKSKYDAVFDFEESSDSFLEKGMLLSIEYRGTIKKVLFIVSSYTPIAECAIPHGNELFMMLNWDLCMFDPATLKITRHIEIDCMGTMNAAYSYKDDFILYGEIEIIRVDSKLNIKWNFFGRDIFVRYKSNDPAFVMKADKICLTDWNEDYYEIDYDGNLLVHNSSGKLN